MSDILPIHEAWRILGKDSKRIIQIIMNYPSLEDRVKVTEEILIRARKIAKKLSVQYHPDVNRNANAEDKFKEVQLAIKSIEHHTEQFKIKAAQIQIERDRNPKTTIIITG